MIKEDDNYCPQIVQKDDKGDSDSKDDTDDSDTKALKLDLDDTCSLKGI